MLNGAIGEVVLSLETLASHHVDAQLYLNDVQQRSPSLRKRSQCLAGNGEWRRANYASERAARETAAHPIDNVTFSPGDRQPVDRCE